MSDKVPKKARLKPDPTGEGEPDPVVAVRLQPDLLDVRPLGRGRYLMTAGDVTRLAHAVRKGGITWVFLDGEVHVIAAAGGRASRDGADDDVALAAPMPATVVAVNVTVGQQVARGDVMVTLEAMKMELPIKAPRDGCVKSVACRPGELVQPGVPLLELE